MIILVICRRGQLAPPDSLYCLIVSVVENSSGKLTAMCLEGADKCCNFAAGVCIASGGKQKQRA